MTLRRFARIIPAVAMVLVVAAGCGDSGPSKDEYEQGLAKVQQHLDDAAVASRESSQADDDAGRRAKLGEAYAALDDAATAADELDPPKEAERAHERFAAALRDYADLFDRLARLKKNDPTETELYTEAGAIAERLDKASRDLKQAGFAVDKGDS